MLHPYSDGGIYKIHIYKIHIYKLQAVATSGRQQLKIKIKMEKSFVIRKSMNLSLKEELVYAVISCNSDENGESHISRKEISNITGIKKHDTITNHTNKLVEEGLITKTYKHVGGKKLVTYKLLSSKKDFM